MSNLYLYAAQFIAIVAVFYVTKPSVLVPTVWTDPNPLPEMTGVLSPNQLLSKENVQYLKGDFGGPESTAIDPETGIVYASLNDGTVASFFGSGEELKVKERILFTPSNFVHHHNEEQSINHILWCREQRKSGKIPWHPPTEQKCGRPLGLRYRKEADNHFLYILDAYYGLFKLNVNTKEVEHIFNESTPIQSIQNSDTILTAGIKFFNDLDILDNGNIIFTDTSYKNSRSENRQELLDASPRSRLFLYNIKEKTLQVKLCGLHFGNGVQIMPKREGESNNEVIVADSARFRLLQVNLDADFLQGTSSLATPSSSSSDSSHITAFSSCGEKGSLYEMLKANKYEVTGVRVFTDSLPGFADNIRLDSQTTTTTTTTTTTSALNKSYYLVGLGTASKKPFSLLWLLYQTPVWIRDVIGKFIPMKFVEKLVPKYGLVIVINEEGKIVSSLHDVTGEGSAFVSQAERHPITGDLWLGSHSEPRLVIVPREKLPARWEE